MRKSLYPPYDAAKQFVRELNCTSISDYHKKLDEKNIKYLPRAPDRVFKDWVSWNDYLGTNNTPFCLRKTNWLPFWEAVKWAQAYADKHNLTSARLWFDHFKDEKNKLPYNVPLHPHLVYSEFYGSKYGWKTWLGTSLKGQMAAATTNTALLLICYSHKITIPQNTVYVLICNTQLDASNVMERDPSLFLHRAYHWDNTLRGRLDELLNLFGVSQGDNTYLIGNVNALLFELDQILLVFKRGNAEKC